MNRPTAERVRELFALDAQSNALVWRKPTSARAKIGSVAGSGSRLSRSVGVDGDRFPLAAIKHLFVTGNWPDGFVDAKSGEVFSVRCASKGVRLTSERLRSVLAYEPETGGFVWKARTAKCINIGDAAGSTSSNGYTRIFIDGKEWLAHRLAWLYVTGEQPPACIDHIDGNRANNRWSNLRSVTHSVNIQNQKVATTRSKLGVLGVGRHGVNTFRAVININGKDKHIGSFKTVEAASAAYLDAKRQFHAGCTI